MPLEYRERYLIRTFNHMHDKLNNAFEKISDGEFEECKGTINSLIYDLKEIKKRMETWQVKKEYG